MRIDRRSCFLGALLLATAACGGGGGGGRGGEEELPKPRTLTIHGGAGKTDVGGGGGYLSVGSGFRSVQVTKEGGLPELPTWSETTPELGVNPRTISSDVTIAELPLRGDDGTTPATGLEIKAGATLTLAMESESEYLTFSLPDGLIVDGTLKVAPAPGFLDVPFLDISAYSAAVHGTIDTRGGDAARGADGGYGGGVGLTAQRNVVVSGAILTAGGTGDHGGSGGSIYLNAGGPAEGAGIAPGILAVTGRLDSSGGEGKAGHGGGAGTSIRSGAEGAVCNTFLSGEIIARGGNGTAGGGYGGVAITAGCEHGWVVHTGTTDVSGGSATVDGVGQGCSILQFLAYNEALYVGGTLRADGGSGTVAGPSDACSISLVNPQTELVTAPTTGIYLSADISGAGGDGAAGGRGSSVSFTASGSPNDAGFHMAGYGSIDAAGGAGTGGGAGGTVKLVASELSTPAGYIMGPVENDVQIVVDGGEGKAGSGGPGGGVTLGTELADPTHVLLSIEAVHSASRGTIQARGGKGTAGGGHGGWFDLQDVREMSSNATVDLSGGDGGTSDGGGGGGLYVYASAAGSFTATGLVIASGGASTLGAGGEGGSVYVGAKTIAVGTLTCDAGKSDSGPGGAGGHVTLDSATPPTQVAGTVSVRGGAGTIAGAVGTFSRDGAEVTLVDGQFKP